MALTDVLEYKSKIRRTLITQEQISEKLKEYGELISEEYSGKPLLLVSILKGAFIFLGDISRNITIPHEIAFMAAQSYFEGTSSSGTVNITLDIAQDISEYNLLIVEDIIDTGRTLKVIFERLKERHPLSIKVITLLDKPERRVVKFEPDYTLFTIPDHFVIGYGLDCGEYYRNLPYIAEYQE
ncbi:MAG: hypoxanthine phosphoribosyltransferase [Ruminococcus sp.]|nr:hypoxanthine phosphoribosyltransferase [Ruminococcus sp.]